VTARERVERSGINGYNHGASPLLNLLLVRLSIQIGPPPASTRPENLAGTPPPITPTKPRPQSADIARLSFWNAHYSSFSRRSK
jgi:hypothetical protein